MAIDLTSKDIVSFGDRANKKQMIFLLPAEATADKPGILVLGNVDGSGIVGNGACLWADNTGAIRYGTTIPTNEDSDGTALSASAGANVTLSNITTAAINTTLASDTDNTDDLGTSAIEWKDLYIDGVAYIDDARLDIAQIGGATNYINVAAAGVLTMAGTATIDGVGSGNLLDKTAVEVVTGAYDFTTGGVEIKEDSLKLGFGAAGVTDSYILFNGTDLIFYDSHVAGTVTLSQLQSGTTLNPVISGNLSLPNGTFNWTDSTDETAAAWNFSNTGAGADIAIVSSATTGEVIKITANAANSGSLISLNATDATITSGAYIYCYDGAAQDFAVRRYGATTIAGNAATTVLTVTAGHILATAGNITATLGNIVATAGNVAVTLGNVALTDGNITSAEGKITIDTVTDETSYVKRNCAVTTGPVVEIEETNVLADNACLLVDHNATGAIDAAQITHDGTGYGLSVVGTAVTGKQLYLAGPASQSVATALIGGTAWVGASTVGMVDIASSGVLAAGANLLRVDSSGANTAASFAVEIIQSGALAGATSGSALRVTDTGAAAGTSYAVYIASTSNEAIHVDSGKVLVDETVTASGGIITKVAVTDIADPPTQANMVAALGAAATAGAGFIGMIDDAAGGLNEFICISNGTNWYYLAKAVVGA